MFCLPVASRGTPWHMQPRRSQPFLIDCGHWGSGRMFMQSLDRMVHSMWQSDTVWACALASERFAGEAFLFVWDAHTPISPWRHMSHKMGKVIANHVNEWIQPHYREAGTIGALGCTASLHATWLTGYIMVIEAIWEWHMLVQSTLGIDWYWLAFLGALFCCIVGKTQKPSKTRFKTFRGGACADFWILAQ